MTHTLNGLLNRVVGYTDLGIGLPESFTRWGRVTGGYFDDEEQWFAIEPLHDRLASNHIRAKRIHTIMPKAY